VDFSPLIAKALQYTKIFSLVVRHYGGEFINAIAIKVQLIYKRFFLTILLVFNI
jgi:hypothetical protein